MPRVLALANLEMRSQDQENSTRLQEKMDDLARRYGPEYPPVRDYRKLKGNMEAQETVSCVILMVNAMLRLCETPAIKRILRPMICRFEVGNWGREYSGEKDGVVFGHARQRSVF